MILSVAVAWFALLERALGHVNVLAQQARGLVGVARAHRAQNGLVLLDRTLEPAAQTERGGEVAAHLVHQREVDALEVVILGALDKEGVEGAVGRKEGVGVVRRGMLPHLALQTAELGEIVVGQIGQSEPDGQVFEGLAHAVGIEKLPWRKRADEGALSRFEGDEPVGGKLVQRLAYGNPADIELAGQGFLGKRGVGRKGVAQDLLAQMLIDLFGQRGVVQHSQLWQS